MRSILASIRILPNVMKPSAIIRACVVSLFLVFQAQATELRIHFQTPDKTQPVIEKAELLVVGWGWTERVPLLAEGGAIQLDFERRTSETPDKFRNAESVQLYVQAKNFVAIKSEPFQWWAAIGQAA